MEAIKQNVIKVDLYTKEYDEDEVFDYKYNPESFQKAGFCLSGHYTFNTMKEYKLFDYALSNANEWWSSCVIEQCYEEDVRPFIDPKMLALAEQKPFVGYYAFGEEAVSKYYINDYTDLDSCDGMFCAWGFDSEGERKAFEDGICLEEREFYIIWISNGVETDEFENDINGSILALIFDLEGEWDRVEVIDGVPYLKPEQIQKKKSITIHKVFAKTLNVIVPDNFDELSNAEQNEILNKLCLENTETLEGWDIVKVYV